MSCLSLPEKKSGHQGPHKLSKSFSKLHRAITRTSHRIATFLSSRSLYSHKRQSFSSKTPYSPITSLYECPCSYHHSQRQKLQIRTATHPVFDYDDDNHDDNPNQPNSENYDEPVRETTRENAKRESRSDSSSLSGKNRSCRGRDPMRTLIG